MPIQCPGEWEPAKNHLSDCHSPAGPRNVNLSGYQSQAIEGIPKAAYKIKVEADVKTRVPDIYKAPLQESLELWRMAEE